MRRLIVVLALLGPAGSLSVRADGLLVPTDASLPPLSLSYQRVRVDVEGQVATTTVEQAYRNATDRDLEADYLFPLPPGASVREFAMWVGGKRFKAESLDASKARETYEDIVRRLQDPGLLEYVGRDLWKARIYPVPRHGEQKIEIKFTSILPRDGGMIAYRYLLHTGQKPRKTIRDFTMVVRIKSPDPLGPIYSPSHAVAIDRLGDREAVASFERNACVLDQDFELYFTPKADRVGLSLMARRDSPDDRGYFLLLLSPRVERRALAIPRDLVVVLDTSSSMGEDPTKLRQARAVLARALDSLGPDDRFALIAFATVPNPFRDGLTTATHEHRDEALAWVRKLEANGGTDIASALETALKLQAASGSGRTFQVVFLTDGLPTVGQHVPERILEQVRKQQVEGTRIFTFGVGDDVDAHLLDQVAEVTRGSSTYVRPSENLEVKASALLSKIVHPVLTDLELKVGGNVRLVEMYPPRLPDLFAGEQMQVVGRYEGHGETSVTLEGRVADRRTSQSFPANFPETATDRDFIAALWARRKVGYLMDQIRLNGETAEVKDELVRLARDYSIATPYTSLLVVPESSPAHQASRRRRSVRSQAWNGFGGPRWGMGMGSMGMSPGMGGRPRGMAGMMGGMGGGMGGMGMAGMGGSGFGGMGMAGMGGGVSVEAMRKTPAPAPSVNAPFGARQARARQEEQGLASVPSSGKDAINLAQRLADLKSGDRPETPEETRTVAGLHFRKVRDAWVDPRYKPTTRTVHIRVLGKAYFQLLARHPELGPILALGERITWVSPSGTAVIIDKQGQNDLPASTLDRLFVNTKQM